MDASRSPPPLVTPRHEAEPREGSQQQPTDDQQDAVQRARSVRLREARPRPPRWSASPAASRRARPGSHRLTAWSRSSRSSRCDRSTPRRRRHPAVVRPGALSSTSTGRIVEVPVVVMRCLPAARSTVPVPHHFTAASSPRKSPAGEATSRERTAVPSTSSVGPLPHAYVRTDSLRAIGSPPTLPTRTSLTPTGSWRDPPVESQRGAFDLRHEVGLDRGRPDRSEQRDAVLVDRDSLLRAVREHQDRRRRRRCCERRR